MIDLQTLQAPSVVQALNYEAILARNKADLADRLRPHLPGVDDVLALESEPLVKLIEAFAYRELLFIATVNDAARAHLLAFATGRDLDHLAALFGVTRMAGEGDERLRLRLQLRIAALASQGTREYYEFQALTTSANVRAAQATQPAAGRVLVMLWCHDLAQAETTRAAVDAVLNSDGGRMLGVGLAVAVAKPRTINITAHITRTRQAPAQLLQLLQQRLADAFAKMDTMATAVARSYITTLLHAEGVAAVEYPDATAPAVSTPIAVGEYPALGTVQLIDMGAV